MTEQQFKHKIEQQRKKIRADQVKTNLGWLDKNRLHECEIEGYIERVGDIYGYTDHAYDIGIQRINKYITGEDVQTKTGQN